MKKALCLLLCLAMLLMSVPSLALEYTLPEKMMKQIEFGNGIKGNALFTLSGEADWLQPLLPLSGVDFQLRGISDNSGWQYRFYALKNEEESGSTWLYSKDGQVLLKSELAPGELLSINYGSDLLSALSADTERPSWYSLALKLASIPAALWNSDWTPALQQTEQLLELWLAGYTGNPERMEENGQVLTRITFDIPAQDILDGAASLLEAVLNQESLMALLKAQATPEQAATYLDPAKLQEYQRILRSAALEGTIHMERKVSVRGETLFSSISLPLPPNELKASQLEILEEGSMHRIVLVTENAQFSLDFGVTVDEAGDYYAGTLSIIPADAQEKPLIADYTMSRSFSRYTDEEAKGHEVTEWTLTAAKGEGDVLDFSPFTAGLTLHYASKSAQRNPTTLTITAAFEAEDAHLAMEATAKTASPWIFEELPTENAEDFLALTAEEQATTLATLGDAFLSLCRELTAVESTEEVDAAEASAEADIPETADTEAAQAEASETETIEDEAEASETETTENEAAKTEASDAESAAAESPETNEAAQK